MAGGIWNGTIAFGLVSIPVKLHAATGSHDLTLHQYHAPDAGRIRYQRICELDERRVERDQIVKGVEDAEGEVVLLDDEDLADLPASASKTIDVVQFVPVAQIDPIFYEKSYYAEPGKAAVKPYVLLREALDDADKVAIVRVAMRQRESLAVLRARDDVLVMHTMLWADEVRRPETGRLEAETRDEERQMAGRLIESMSGEWRPEEHTDDYQEALRERIDAKRQGRDVAAARPERPKAKVIDLMDALERSVDQAGADTKPAKQPAPKKAAKKSAKKAAKKPAKQTAKKPRKRSAAG